MYPQPPSGFPPTPPACAPPFTPPAPSMPYGTPRKKGMALASLLMSLVLPLTVGAAFLIVQMMSSANYSDPASKTWSYLILPMLLVGVLPLVYLAAASMAVVFGHVTRARARQLPPDLIRDWMADIGLLLGYIG